MSARKTTRFSIDLMSEQHRFLKLFSVENDVQSSVVCRALLYLQETDDDLANEVVDIIKAEDV